MNKKTKLLLRIVSISSALLGLAIIAWVIFPIVSYNLTKKQKFAAFKTTNNTIDYTKASNWLPESKQSDFSTSNVSYYTISVPKLKIENATVAIGGEDLSEHLIQYPGTAVPGKRGNAVIFGHSVLPQFYNPKNYISIFSTLQNLKMNDEILVSYDGVSYKYKIESMTEVMPTDSLVLEQNLGDSFLTLVTCTPPGDPTKPRRLVVKARVVPPEVGYANTRN